QGYRSQQAPSDRLSWSGQYDDQRTKVATGGTGGEWPLANPKRGASSPGHAPELGNSCPDFQTERGDHSGEGPRGAGPSLFHPEAQSSTEYPPESDMIIA